VFVFAAGTNIETNLNQSTRGFMRHPEAPPQLTTTLQAAISHSSTSSLFVLSRTVQVCSRIIVLAFRHHGRQEVIQRNTPPSRSISYVSSPIPSFIIFRVRRQSFHCFSSFRGLPDIFLALFSCRLTYAVRPVTCKRSIRRP
jgi:hypothetical protein